MSADVTPADAALLRGLAARMDRITRVASDHCTPEQNAYRATEAARLRALADVLDDLSNDTVSELREAVAVMRDVYRRTDGVEAGDGYMEHLSGTANVVESVAHTLASLMAPGPARGGVGGEDR